MKTLLCISILIVSFLLGKQVLKSTRMQLDTLTDILKLIEHLKININYSHKKKKEILDDFSKNCKSSLNLLINGEKTQILPENILENVNVMFREIGTTDVSGQNMMLERYELIFKTHHKDLDDKYKSMNSYVIKLALCFGLAVCVLLL